jgi:hypothetical protein
MFWMPPSTSLTLISLTYVLYRLCQRTQTQETFFESPSLNSPSLGVFNTTAAEHRNDIPPGASAKEPTPQMLLNLNI